MPTPTIDAELDALRRRHAAERLAALASLALTRSHDLVAGAEPSHGEAEFADIAATLVDRGAAVEAEFSSSEWMAALAFMGRGDG